VTENFISYVAQAIGAGIFIVLLYKGLCALLKRPAPSARSMWVVFAVFMGLSLLGQYSRHLDPDYKKQKVAASFDRIPLGAVLKKYEPATYADVLNAISEVDGSDAAAEQRVTVIVGNALDQAVKRRLPSTSDEAVVLWTNAYTQVVRQVQKQDPAKCYALLFGAPSGDNWTLGAGQAGASLAEAKIKVIESSAQNPQQPASTEQFEAAMKKIGRKLGQRYGAKAGVLLRLTDPNVDKADACELVTAMYEEAARLPQSEAGPVIRRMLQS